MKLLSILNSIIYNTIGYNTLITTSAWKNDQGASIGSIGIMLNKKINKLTMRGYITL